jgi:hypothetical protein
MIGNRRLFPVGSINFLISDTQAEVAYWWYENEVATTQLFCFIAVEEQEAPGPDYRSGIGVLMRIDSFSGLGARWRIAVLAVFASVDLMIRDALSFSGISMTPSLNLKSLITADVLYSIV